MRILNPAEIKCLKKMYPKGTRVEIDYMNDPDGIPSGSIGTVIHIDSIGQIHLEEFGLALIPDVDRFHKIE